MPPLVPTETGWHLPGGMSGRAFGGTSLSSQLDETVLPHTPTGTYFKSSQKEIAYAYTLLTLNI